MLWKRFNAGKCKMSLRLAISRIKILKNKKDIQLKQMRRDLAQLLENGQDQTARIRVENAIQEEKTIAAYDFIELYCEQIVARLPDIEAQKKCPVDLKEAISSVIFASPRCADIPELLKVRKQFSRKYGKEFVEMALELRPDSGVNRLVVEKLSARAPDIDTKIKVLTEIAKENNINWESFEENMPNGPTSFTHNLGSPSIQSQPSSRQTQEPAPEAQQKDEDRLFPGSDFSPTQPGIRTTGTHEVDKPPDSRNVEDETSLDRQKWQLNFKDATSAAQAAADAAERASLAARAVVELASEFSQASNFERHSLTERAEKYSEVDSEEDQAATSYRRASGSRKIPGKSREKIDFLEKENNSSEDEHFEQTVNKPGKVDFQRNHSRKTVKNSDDEEATASTSRAQTKTEKASSSRSGSIDLGTVWDSPRQNKPVEGNSSSGSGQQIKNGSGDYRAPPLCFDPSDSDSEEHWGVDNFFREQKSTFQVEDYPTPQAQKSVTPEDFSTGSVESQPSAVVYDETSTESEEEPPLGVDRGQNAASKNISDTFLSPTAAHSRTESGDEKKFPKLTGGLRNRGQTRPSLSPRPAVNEFLPSEALTNESPGRPKAGTSSTAQKKISPRKSIPRTRPLKSYDSDSSDSNDLDDLPPAEEKVSTSLKRQDADELQRKISYHGPAGSSSKISIQEPGPASASSLSSQRPKQIKVPFFDEEEEEVVPLAFKKEEVVPLRRTVRTPIASQRSRTPVIKSERTQKQPLQQQQQQESLGPLRSSPSLQAPEEPDQRSKIESRSILPPAKTDQRRTQKQPLQQQQQQESSGPSRSSPSLEAPEEPDQRSKTESRSILPPAKTDQQVKTQPRGILPPKEGSSHVHPSLPDYDSLAAHFRALRSNQR